MHLFLFFLIVIFKWESEDACGSLLVSKPPPPHTHSLLVYVKYILVLVHSSFSLG